MLSNGFFFAANSIQALVMSWLVYDITRSISRLGSFTAVSLLPMLLGPIGGIVAERVSRVRLLRAG